MKEYLSTEKLFNKLSEDIRSHSCTWNDVLSSCSLVRWLTVSINDTKVTKDLCVVKSSPQFSILFLLDLLASFDLDDCILLLETVSELDFRRIMCSWFVFFTRVSSSFVYFTSYATSPNMSSQFSALDSFKSDFTLP